MSEIGAVLIDMTVEERIRKLEQIVAEDEGIRRIEHKSLRIVELVLFWLTLAALIIWGTCELLLFLLERWNTIKHALGL